MLKEILIHETKEETKVAVLEDKRLVEVYLERSFQGRLAGNIYKGKIENVLPGMQAAFVNIGLERNAFLYVDEAGGAEAKSLPIQNLLQEGQELLVQVVKEPFGTKGARVTTQITLPGRYVVLFPGGEGVGVSRRIKRAGERERLKSLAEEAKVPGCGLIVRTAAEGATREELQADVRALSELWERIQKKAARLAAPALVHRELELVSWVVRDLFGEDVDRLLVSDPGLYERVLELLDNIGPHLKERVSCAATDLWEDYALDQEVTRALQPKVWLRSGGYLVIDETEALTAIDVNTGKYIGKKDFAETVFRTNLEAVREIVRQIRLRNLGGIIIIDFIDMDFPEHRAAVLRRLEDELKKDRTQTSLLGITHLGLVELTRKKVRPSLSSLLERPCPHCGGKGRVLSEETLALRVWHSLRHQARSSLPCLLVEAHPRLASFLVQEKGQHLRELEGELGREIVVRGVETLGYEDFTVRAVATPRQ